MSFILTLPVPILDEEKKLSQIFIVTLLCDASKVFTKALKAFKKPFKAPQRSVKIKFKLKCLFQHDFQKGTDVKVNTRGKIWRRTIVQNFHIRIIIPKNIESTRTLRYRLYLSVHKNKVCSVF